VDEEAPTHWGLLRPNKKKTSKESLNLYLLETLQMKRPSAMGIMLSTFNKYYSANL
jgi:hypothetical protein